MCGICGIVGQEASRETTTALVTAMLGTIAHRGPDGQGLHQGPGFAFGHRLLAILDRENGQQPLVDESGQLILVYNGEIYNYLELRQSLLRKGFRFRTFTDTEVLLRLYECYGTDCVDHLNGMFAFALFDRRHNRLFAARDRFGIKPFYYTHTPEGGLLFASEIKALFMHPGVAPQWHAEGLHEYVRFQFCLGDKTLFKDIHRLPAGHRLLFCPGEEQPCIAPYWRLNYEVDFTSEESCFTDNLLMLLQDAVDKQMRSDVPVGAYLSGGLDSGTITALAATRHGPGFPCFLGRFDQGNAYDELPFARHIATAHGCQLHMTTPTAADLIQLLPRLVYHMDEPAAGPGLFPQYMVSRLAKEHVTVVLAGSGGDELFGGYARYLVAYLEQCIKGAILETREEGHHIIDLQTIIPNLPQLRTYLPLLQSFWSEGVFEPMDRRYYRLVDRGSENQAVLHPDIGRHMDESALFERFQQLFNAPDTHSYVNKMTHFDQQTLLPALLQVEDRVSMAVSLESRVPLLDHRIAELMVRMPPRIKFRNGELKYIFKRAVRHVLPRETLGRKDKMGFPVPLQEWYKGPLREFVQDTLLSATCRQRGLWNESALTRLLNDEAPFGRQLWGILNLELWFRAFFDGRPGAPP